MLQALCAKYGAYYSRAGNGICHYVHVERFAKPGDDPGGRRLAHHHQRRAGDDRDRRRRPRRRGGDGRLPVRDRLPGDRRGSPRRHARAPLGAGQGRHPRAAAPAQRERRQEQDLRVHRPGHRRPVGPRARHDREHDRRARRHLGGLPARRARRATGCGCSSARTTSRTWRPTRAASYDERVEIDLAALGPLVAKPHNPDNVVPVEELAGTEVAQVCIGSSVNSGYFDLALPGAVLADRDGQIVHPSDRRHGHARLAPDPQPRSPSRASTASSWRAACGCSSRCAARASGMGQAPPSDANSLRTFNRNFPGRSGTPEDRVYLCSPAVAAVSMLQRARSRTRASTASRPTMLAAAGAQARTSTTSTSSRRRARSEAERDRDPARAEHQAAARARAARRTSLEATHRHGPAATTSPPATWRPTA